MARKKDPLCCESSIIQPIDQNIIRVTKLFYKNASKKKSQLMKTFLPFKKYTIEGHIIFFCQVMEKHRFSNNKKMVGNIFIYRDNFR